MPIANYFKGSGNKVMSNMKSEYGDKKGKQVFYATANKGGESLKPPGKRKKAPSLPFGKVSMGKAPFGKIKKKNIPEEVDNSSIMEG